MAERGTVLGIGLDPITFEVIQNALESIVDEMAITVMRTAYSGLIKDSLDYSTGLCSVDGELISQGLTLVLQTGSLGEAVQAIQTKFRDRVYSGDVFIVNDPYGAGGTHLPDITIVRPVFVDGTLECYACVVAHHADVGGITPGSNATMSTDIFQEGLRFPPVKLFDRHVPNEALLDFAARNVRTPKKLLGDLRAQMAACLSGERGYQALAARYGVDQLRIYRSAILDYTERLARRDIEELPDGIYTHEARIDGDAIGGPITIKAAVEVAGDRVHVDFEGTSPQVAAGINSPFSSTRSAVLGAVRLVLGPDLPRTSGYFRAIDFTAPLGTIVNPRSPAPCGARGITAFRVMDAVMGALAAAVPDRVPAEGEGGNTVYSIGGYDTHGQFFVYVDTIAGSRGGSSTSDGREGVPHPGANAANTPIELIEAEFPVRFERYGLVPDTGGPGLHRGALALVRELRFLGTEATFEIRSDKRRFPPTGLLGGAPGSSSMTTITGERGQTVLPTLGVAPLTQDVVVRHVLAGGGGWGNPFERDRSEVERDVRFGKVSVEAAREQYGVVIDPTELVVDSAATEILRKSRSVSATP